MSKTFAVKTAFFGDKDSHCYKFFPSKLILQFGSRENGLNKCIALQCLEKFRVTTNDYFR